jgi:type I restriction enzyme S subunit
MSEAYRLRPLGEVMSLDIQRTTMTPGTTYRLAGVLNAGQGVIAKGEFDGGDTEYAAMNVLRADQVIMRKLTAWEGPIAVVPIEFDGFVVSTEFPTFTLGEDVIPAWMRAVCGSPRLWAEMKSRVTGTVQRRKRLNPDQLLQIEFPIPSTDVQQRIVDVLGAVDEQIAALDDEATAQRRLLGGFRRELESDSDKTLLADLAMPGGIQIGPFGSQLHAYEYTDDPEGVPVVMPRDLVDGQIITRKIKRVPDAVAARLARHRLMPGDVVFPRRGDLSKRALVGDAQEGWLCGTGCIRFRPRDRSLAPLLIEVLSGDVTTEWLVEHAVGTTMLNLNTEILSRLPVTDIERGQSAVSSSTALQGLIRATVAETDRLRDARAGLLSALIDHEIEVAKPKGSAA